MFRQSIYGVAVDTIACADTIAEQRMQWQLAMGAKTKQTTD